MPNRNKFLIIILVVVFVAVGFFIWQGSQKTPNSPNSEDSNNFPQDLKSQMPDLSRPIVITENLTEEAKIKVREEIKEWTGKIEENYDQLEAWLILGVLRKTIGDYEGAGEAWEFASLLRPKNSVSFSNLGNLYWHYLPDFPRAESNFLKAITNNPEDASIYQSLHELYFYSYKEKADLADDILLRGIGANPDNVSLLVSLAIYYQEAGDKEKARIYFKQALVIDPSNTMIQEELDNL